MTEAELLQEILTAVEFLQWQIAVLGTVVGLAVGVFLAKTWRGL